MGVAFDASVLRRAVDAVARSQQMPGAVAVEAGFFPAVALERQEAVEINIGQRGFRYQPEGLNAVMASMPSELVAAAQSHAEGEAYVQIESDAEDEAPEEAAVEAAAAVVEEVVTEVAREAAQTQQTQRNAEESKSAAAVTGDHDDDEEEPLTDIDLSKYTSAEQLESCGLKRLKYALEQRGVKAGYVFGQRNRSVAVDLVLTMCVCSAFVKQRYVTRAGGAAVLAEGLEAEAVRPEDFVQEAQGVER